MATRLDFHAMTEETLAAVLWDMDGTLIDTEPLWIAAEHGLLDRYGIPMGEDIPEQLIGSGLHDAAELFQRLGVPLTQEEIIHTWLTSVIDGLRAAAPRWRPGAVELLQSLREAGIPCALVTMSFRSLAEEVIGLLPPGMFSAMITGDAVAHEKPHPDPYLRGAAALDVSIRDCIAIEDSPPGLRSAVASGAVSIGVPNLIPLDQTPTHALLPTLEGESAATLTSRFHTLRQTEPSAQPFDPGTHIT